MEKALLFSDSSFSNYEDLMLVFSINDSKLNAFGLWTIGWLKWAICQVRGIKKDIFHCFQTFLKQNDRK